MNDDDMSCPAAILSSGEENLRLTEVLSRVAVNYTRLMSPSNAAVIAEAAKYCLGCDHAGTCDRWIASHEEGSDNALPAFCPVIRGMALLGSREPVANEKQELRPS